MDALEGFLGFMGVTDELESLRAENERLHAKVSDLTARLRKCSELHRRSEFPRAGDNGVYEAVQTDDPGAERRKQNLGPQARTTRGRKVPVRT